MTSEVAAAGFQRGAADYERAGRVPWAREMTDAIHAHDPGTAYEPFDYPYVTQIFTCRRV